MNYPEAAAIVDASDYSTEKHMVITFPWEKMVFPYQDGLAVMAALTNAQTLEDPYKAIHRFKEIDRSRLSVNIMPQAEYRRIRISALMGLPMEEIIAAEKAYLEPPTEPTDPI